MLGCSSVNSASRAIDVHSAQLLSNPMAVCVNAGNSFPVQHAVNQYSLQPLLAKDVSEAQGNGILMNHASTAQYSTRFGRGQERDGCDSRSVDGLANRQPVLPPGTGLLTPGMRVHSSPAAYPVLQQYGLTFASHQLDRRSCRSLSVTSPAVESYDRSRGFIGGCYAEEKQSSDEKSSGSSNKGQIMEQIVGQQVAPRSRWKPNPHQVQLLKQHFESGFTKATSELHAAVQGCGHATERNVTLWLKNRASRHKKPQVKVPLPLPQKKSCLLQKPVEGGQLQTEDSDDENPWADFNSVSRQVLSEVSGVVSGIRQQDVLFLARSVQKARQILCYGAGREAFVMKAFASGLHHLGFDAFFMEDTNAPPFDHSSLLLMSAGPSSRNRVAGVMEEALRARARIIIFGTYTLADPETVFTIQIPTLPSHSGSDGEVMSGLPNSPHEALPMTSLFDLSVTLLCDCVCVMLKRAGSISPAKIRARHTNLE